MSLHHRVRGSARAVAAGLLVLIAAGLAPIATPEPASAVATQSPSTAPTSAPALVTALVTTQPGDLPLILSAPHGGRLPVPGVAQRTGANVPAKRGAKTNFTFALDRDVDTLAFRLADDIQRATGRRPYVVVAHFSRRFIDANRPPEEGVESDLARPVYDQYHDALKTYRAEILRKWGRGLLVDLHGHGGDPETLIRGTADWQSVRHLVDTYGKSALTGPDGLLAPLAAAGVQLVPPNTDDDARENPSLNGGYITRHYGSFAGSSFDAIQFECGLALRAPDRLPTFSQQLADTLTPFLKRYLLPPE